MHVAPPVTPPLELERLRRAVRAQLFDRESAPVKIGRFDVVGCLGEGGMGIVYAALDEALGRTVAIKLLRPELSEDSRGGRRLASEAKSLARLSHPNVVSVFDVGEHEGQRFIAMEYVDGQTLRRWLDVPREIGAIVEVFEQAGRGLAAAHAVGLVHRDFKPDNVLVGRDGRPRVLDFGLARAPEADDSDGSPPALDAHGGPYATSLTRDGALVGTPAYMAPEQHLGDPADDRSDQFAFCVALWEALTGALPFPGDDVRTISLAIVAGRRGSISGVPDRLLRLLDRGLAIRPEARFASMDALLDELTRWEQPLVGDDALDTREIDRAIFGARDPSAPPDGRAPSGLARLAPGDLADAMSEAGLAPRSPPAPTASSALVPRPAAPETLELGYATVASFAAEVEGMRLPTVRALARVLDQELEGAGAVDGDSGGLTWASRHARVSLEPTVDGTRLLLRWDLRRLARRRRRRWMLGAGFLGWFSGMLIAESTGWLKADDAMAVFFVLLNTMGSVFAGWAIGRRLQGRAAEHARRRLAWAAERIAALPPAHARGPDLDR